MIIGKLFEFENAHIVRSCSSKRCKYSIHGHSYKLELELESSFLDNAGMVYDFGLLKQEIKEEPKKEESPKIKIDDFAKIKIKVAKVLDCQNIEGSEKLLKFQLELDDKEIRQVLSGIAKYYKASDLIGKQVCIISNLKKAKIFGHESDGMILSAKSGDKLVLITPEQLVQNGSLVG